jgi:FkbM family methyltransferase
MLTGRGRLHNYLIELNLSQAVERQFYFMGYHDERELELLIDAIVRPGDTFIDVGANLGFISMHAASRVGSKGRVIAFEPQPACCERIARNIFTNGLKHVDVKNIGLSDRADVLTLKLPSGVSSLATFAGDEKLADAKVLGRIDVPVARGDEVVRDQIVGNLMMKIDVEGFELFVLRGFAETIRRRHPPIHIEIQPHHLRRAGVSVSEVFDWFRSMGYCGYVVSLDGKWIYAKLQLRAVAVAEDLGKDMDSRSDFMRNMLWLPSEGGGFDPSPYLAG